MILPKAVTKSKKRVGRGYGSGKGGHTSGRGQKGQKARNSVGILFEGMKARKSLLSRLPFQRGKSKFKPNPKPIAIDLDDLNTLRAGSTVDIDSLVASGLVSEKDARTLGVKILGSGKLEKKLTVTVPTSSSAREAIEKSGGAVK